MMDGQMREHRLSGRRVVDVAGGAGELRQHEGPPAVTGVAGPDALRLLAQLLPAPMLQRDQRPPLDRLERGGWVTRDRDPSDRRAVAIRALRGRNAELIGLYAGMNASMDEICAGYTGAELELLAGFLRRTAAAGQAATDELAGD